MTINEIKELIQLIDQTSINDFQYQKDGYKIKIRKNSGEVQVSAPTVKPQPKQTEISVPAGTTSEGVATTAEDTLQAAVEVSEVSAPKAVEGKAVKSPLVGVYYASPSPTSPAFIQVGSAVKKGDVLCIVEAMKIMNEIVAEEDGVVTEICAENETLVEYGQTLVRIG